MGTLMITVLSIGSFITGLEPTTVALIGTVFGGVGLKVTEHWLSRNKVRVDEAATIRAELRAEVTSLRTENRQLEKDVDQWKLEYYALRDTVAKFKSAMKEYNIKEEDL